MEDAELHVSGGILIRWNSIAGMEYTVSHSTDLPGGFIGVASNIEATPPENTYTGSMTEPGPHVYRVEME